MYTQRGKMMMLNRIMIQTHEVWLEVLMAAFMSKTSHKQRLFYFSDILFRHFTWLEHEHIIKNIPYTYDRDAIPIKVAQLQHILQDIISRLQKIEKALLTLTNPDLTARMQSDIGYIRSVLEHMEDEEVSAFDMKRVYPESDLSEEARDALTLFLFEETYKEYELILIYNYLKAHSNDAFLNRIFQILIDESFFHLRSFGEMAAKMGILAVPRTVMKELYQIDDVVQFLHDGIKEELAAKEECKKLSEAVGKDSASLAQFFDFINQQENYHIALMNDALHYYKEQKEAHA